MKRISVVAWHQLHEAHRGGPELSSADCCMVCAREALALVASHSNEEARPPPRASPCPKNVPHLAHVCREHAVKQPLNSHMGCSTPLLRHYACRPHCLANSSGTRMQHNSQSSYCLAVFIRYSQQG